MLEALALMELDSVATGLAVIDALTKRAHVVVWSAGVVEPGRFLILLTAPLGDLEEAWDAALNRASGTILDKVLIPFAHPAVERGLRGHREVEPNIECIGICETNSVSSALIACDRSLKDANVSLAGFRFSPGMGGRAYFAVTGTQHDVQSAVEVSLKHSGKKVHRTEIIAMPTVETLDALLAPGVFSLNNPLGG